MALLTTPVAAEVGVGSGRDERLATDLTLDRGMADPPPLSGTGVDHRATTIVTAYPLGIMQLSLPAYRPVHPHGAATALAAEALDPFETVLLPGMAIEVGKAAHPILSTVCYIDEPAGEADRHRQPSVVCRRVAKDLTSAGWDEHRTSDNSH